MCLTVTSDIIYTISEKMIVYKCYGEGNLFRYKTWFEDYIYYRGILQKKVDIKISKSFFLGKQVKSINKGYHFNLGSEKVPGNNHFDIGVFELPIGTKIVYGTFSNKNGIVADQCIYLGTLRQYQRQQFINKWINKIKNVFKY